MFDKAAHTGIATAALPTDPTPTLTRSIDTAGIIDGELELTLTEWSDSTLADDRLLVEVFADGNPVPVTAVFAGGDGLPAGTGGTPDTVTVDITSLLPADEVTVHLSVASTVDEQLTPAPVFLIDTVAVVLTVDETTTTDSFTYDAAGRMLTRDVDGTETTLTWDASSNLTSTTADGVVTIYAYDAGGQRVAQATLASGGIPGTASAYVAGMELTDPNTAVADNVTGTRFYTFGGATVAVRTAQGLSLLLGDEQGSAQIMMPLNTDSTGALLPATQADADATERTAYAPYGARRGEDLEDINRGWLGQVEDTRTGLTYLNARYYDPALGRFLSPDPLMDPGDPRTLDPYRYADNNPVVYIDPSGLAPSCSGLIGHAYKACAGYASNTANYVTGQSTQQAAALKNGANIGTGYAAKAKNPPILPRRVDATVTVAVVDRMVGLTNAWNASGAADDFRSLHSGNFNFILRESNRAARGDKGATFRSGLYFWSSRYDAEYAGALHLLRYWSTDGEHDFKVYEREEFGIDWNVRLELPGTDATVRADALGNIQYGYLMADWGVDAQNAVDGSNTGGTAGRSDDFDDRMIRAGYELHAMYPNGLETDDVLAYLASDRFRKQVGRRRRIGVNVG